MDELYFSENLYIFKNNILNEAIAKPEQVQDKIDKFGKYISVENNAKNFLKMLVGVELKKMKYDQYKDEWQERDIVPNLAANNVTSSNFTKDTTELLNFVNEVNLANIQNPIITQINNLIPEVTSEIVKYINVNFSDLKLKQGITVYTIFSNENYENLDNVINALFESPNNDAAAEAIFNLYTQYNKFDKFNKLLDLLYCKNK